MAKKPKMSNAEKICVDALKVAVDDGAICKHDADEVEKKFVPAK